MRRTSILIFSTAALLAACKIEQTPRSYIDRQLPAAAEQEAAEEELRARLLLLTQAVNRDDEADALVALAPAPDASIIGFNDEMQASGVGAASTLLREMMQEGRLRLELQEARIWVGPEADIGWFTLRWGVRRRQDLASDTSATVRLSGVYLQHEGAWRLVHAHLSVPTDSLIAVTRADSIPVMDSPEPE